MLCIVTPPCPVISEDILPVGLPDSLAAGVGKEPDPDQNVIRIRAQGMARPDPTERKIKEETIKIRIVRRSVPHDHWNVSIKPFGWATLLDGYLR